MRSLRSLPLAWCPFVCALAALTIAFTAARADATRELVFLNWSDFMDPELIEAFEDRHDARIRQVFFSNNDDRDRLLIAAKGEGYDLAVVNEIALDSYRSQGWLAPLSPVNTPNVAHIRDKWLDLYPAAIGYAAPYFWGTLGIAYRADLLPDGYRTWKEFFKPTDALKNKIAMTGDAIDTIGMALKALGFSANSTDRDQLAAAESLLPAHKPLVRTYDYVSLTRDSALVTGDVVASMMYSGDALMVAEHEPEITYVVPEEGGNLWVDYLVVLERSKNKDLARAFVDFLNEPANAAQLAQYVYYATPNAAAEALLPDEFLNDPAIYPPADVIACSETYAALPPRAERQRAMIYARIAD